MLKKYRLAIFLLLSVIAVLLAIKLYYMVAKSDAFLAVLDPRGIIAYKERSLLINSTLLMMIVVLPVLVLTGVIAWRYRESNKRAKYDPNWDESTPVELIWWGVPFIIIAVLAVMTWKSSHELDPFRPLESPVKPLRIQVVALQWKWLFIYPEQSIATLNYFQFPEKTPINFEITSDAPMNSFWIPQIGGQIYAMPGMTSKLHLIASEPGNYRGCSANLSGTGFSHMTFSAIATSPDEFESWVQEVKQSQNYLTRDEYQNLVKPSIDTPRISYQLKEEGLFEQTVMKYMVPMPSEGK